MVHPLELQMQPERWNQHGSAVAIVAGILDVLQPRCHVYSTPDVRRVVGLHDIFAAVIESAVTDQKAVASVCQIALVIF